MAEPSAALRAEVEASVCQALGHKIVGWREMVGGKNNRLYRLEIAGAPALALKLYGASPWAGETGNFLDREYRLLEALRGRDITAVPRPYLRGDERAYAVYSFEDGKPSRPADLSAEAMRALGAFTAALHSFGPDDLDVDLPTATEAGLSLADQIAAIESRLSGFERHAADPDAPAMIRGFHQDVDLRTEIRRQIGWAIDGMTDQAIAAPLPRSAWRIASGDFGAQNLLVDGPRVAVVDWEWGGWDDPARMVAGFATHGGSEGITPEATAAFLRAYLAARPLDPAERARFIRVGRLQEPLWLATYATALAPEALAARRFAVDDFDEHAYLTEVIDLIRRRLDHSHRDVVAAIEESLA